MCSVVPKYTFRVLVLDWFDIFGACDKSFRNLPLSQPAFNTCEINWLQSAMLQLHSLFPVFFLTGIYSQGIDSGLWTESGWQSLAITLSSEYCLFWPTSWILLVFHSLPFFCILRERLFFPCEKKWPKIWKMAEVNSATQW